MGIFNLTFFLIAALTLSACGIHYKSDGANNIWQTPKKTREIGTGDCEDLAIYEFSQHQEAWIVWGFVNSQSHMWVEVDNEVIDYLDGDRVELIRFNKEVYLKDGKYGNACDIRKWCDVLREMK
jgi:hypothetical protein